MTSKLTRIRGLRRCVSLAVLAAATASCGDLVRSSRSPVTLVVNSLTAGPNSTGTFISDVIRNVTTPAPCSTANPCPTVFNDMASASLGVVMKDVTVAPTANNAVTITRYHVEYRRADGHNTPGVDVPFPFDGAVTGTIAAGGASSVGFELVRHTAKAESPLVQLGRNPNIISTITSVTFFGADRVGNDVSATGSISIDFGNFGDTP